MPNQTQNQITEHGLQIQTLSEIVDDLTEAMKDIYGDNIDISANTPDGQWLHIIATCAYDQLQLISQVYHSFNPDTASGIVLDQRCAINGIQRKKGTYTLQELAITTDRPVTLLGLDGTSDNESGTGYTVADDIGNQWILLQTQNITTPNTHACMFRAKEIGPVYPTLNTITHPIDSILGVTQVTNNVVATTLGEPEETDGQLRVRRQFSIEMGSAGNIDSLRGVLLNLSGVNDVRILENTENHTDETYQIPPHSIWVIVDGGTKSDIAQMIYNKKAIGCDMKGDQSVDITRPNGEKYTVRFSTPSKVPLYIHFSIIPRDNTSPTYDPTAITQKLADGLVYRIGQPAYIADIITKLEKIIPNHIPINLEISKNGSDWGTHLDSVHPNDQFTVNKNNITIIES